MQLTRCLSAVAELLVYAVQALAKTYESMNDKWRALGYQKAITSLKKHSRAITSFEVSEILQFEILIFF